MNRSSGLAKVLLPLACIATALIYVYVTQDYPDSESIRYPYTVAVAVIVLFAIIAAFEFRAWQREHHNSVDVSDEAELRTFGMRLAQLRPWFIVIATIGYTLVIPTLKTILATLLYVSVLRVALGKANARMLLIDIAAVFAIFVMFAGILRIDLPSGPLEEAITKFMSY